MVQSCEVLTHYRISQRLKQLQKGRDTGGYDRYRRAVDKSQRQLSLKASWHPHTPDPHEKCSFRNFSSKTRSWRRQLHLWSNLSDEEFNKILSISKNRGCGKSADDDSYFRKLVNDSFCKNENVVNWDDFRETFQASSDNSFLPSDSVNPKLDANLPNDEVLDQFGLSKVHRKNNHSYAGECLKVIHNPQSTQGICPSICFNEDGCDRKDCETDMNVHNESNFIEVLKHNQNFNRPTLTTLERDNQTTTAAESPNADNEIFGSRKDDNSSGRWPRRNWCAVDNVIHSCPVTVSPVYDKSHITELTKTNKMLENARLSAEKSQKIAAALVLPEASVDEIVAMLNSEFQSETKTRKSHPNQLHLSGQSSPGASSFPTVFLRSEYRGMKVWGDVYFLRQEDLEAEVEDKWNEIVDSLDCLRILKKGSRHMNRFDNSLIGKERLKSDSDNPDDACSDVFSDNENDEFEILDFLERYDLKQYSDKIRENTVGDFDELLFNQRDTFLNDVPKSNLNNRAVRFGSSAICHKNDFINNMTTNSLTDYFRLSDRR